MLDISYTFIRSLTLDAWNEKQLKCMTNGGNKNVKDLFESYDLFDMPLEKRYTSKIA
jgi:hypothetical protein